MKQVVCGTIITALLAAGCGGTHLPAQQVDSPLTYHDATYGLEFSLPGDWRGYSVLSQQWEAQKYNQDRDAAVFVGRGPIIVLRHPLWRVDDRYQDIPILVFTREQWDADRKGDLTIFAGGIESEICHNTRYVFATNSRFNADDSVKQSREAGETVARNATAAPHLDEEP
jgi:hypothetical protein